MKNHSRKKPILIKELREEERIEDDLPVEENLDEKLEESLKSDNYNDRADGYGIGEAESCDENRAYEKDPDFTQHCIDMGEGYRPHKNEPYTRDEYGLRNQYGPVDQYTFRDTHLFDRGKKKAKDDEIKEKENK